jgi:hypothetical protein
MTKYGSIIGLVSFAVIAAMFIIYPVTQIYAGEQVKWKTFNEKNGLFTIKYPSNWIPQKMGEFGGVEVTSPIAMNFIYSGSGPSGGAIITITADESIFTNVTDLIDSIYAYGQSLSKYKVLEPMECGKYMINGINACSTVLSYKNVELPGKPIVNELDVVTIDEDGVQYVIGYIATKDSFDDLLPVAQEMIKSFNVTGSVLSSEGESTSATGDSPELPPLTESPTVKKL